MPIFSILFFILSLGNCGVPLTLNFVGELCLYMVYLKDCRYWVVFASSSIVFSAAYTIYMLIELLLQDHLVNTLKLI